eukprot:1060649-Pyramimonas_sp.AAC.1
MNTLLTTSESQRLREIEQEEKRRRDEQLERELAKRPVRGNPLGMDRRWRRYWWFGSARERVHVLDDLTGVWHALDTKEEVHGAPP